MDITNFQGIVSQIVDQSTQQKLNETFDTLQKIAGVSRNVKTGVYEISQAGNNLGGVLSKAVKLKSALASKESIESMRALAVATGASDKEIKALNTELDKYKKQIKESAAELRKIDPTVVKKLGVEMKDIEGLLNRSIRHLKDLNKNYRELKENYQALGVALTAVEKGGKVAVSGVQQVYSSVLSLFGLGVGIGAFFGLLKEGYTESRRLGRSYIEIANSLGIIGVQGKKAFAPDLLHQMKYGITDFKNELGLTRDEALKIYEALGKEGIGRPIESSKELKSLVDLAGTMKVIKNLSEEITFQYAHQNIRKFGNTTSQVGWQLDKLSGLSEELGMDTNKYIPEVMSLSQAFEDQSVSALTVAQSLNKIYNSGYLAKYGLNLTLKEASQIVSVISRMTAPQQFNPINALKAQNLYGGNFVDATMKWNIDSMLGKNMPERISASFKLLRQIQGSSTSTAKLLAVMPNVIEQFTGESGLTKTAGFSGYVAKLRDSNNPVASLSELENLLLAAWKNNRDNIQGGKGFDPKKERQDLIDLYKREGQDEIKKVIDDFFINVVQQADPVFKKMKEMLNSILKTFGLSTDRILKLGLALPLVLGAAAVLGSVLVSGISLATKVALTSMVLLKTAALGGSKWGAAALAGTAFITAFGMNYALATGGDMLSQATTGKNLGGKEMKGPHEALFDPSRAAASAAYAGPALLSAIPGVGPAIGGLATMGTTGLHAANMGSDLASGLQKQMSTFSQQLNKEVAAVADAAAQQEEVNDKLVEESKNRDLLQSFDKYEKSLRKLSEELEKAVRANENVINYMKLDEIKQAADKHNHDHGTPSQTKAEAPPGAVPLKDASLSKGFQTAGIGAKAVYNGMYDKDTATLYNNWSGTDKVDLGKIFGNAKVKSQEGEEVVLETERGDIINLSNAGITNQLKAGQTLSGVHGDASWEARFMNSGGNYAKNAGDIFDILQTSTKGGFLVSINNVNITPANGNAMKGMQDVIAKLPGIKGFTEQRA